MLNRSKIHILLADHTKFNKIFMSQTCDFDQLDILITDQIPSKEYVNLLEQNNCQLVIAN
jgi:DeoR/GlpR family transcriptional regulator of sugar metabolism